MQLIRKVMLATLLTGILASSVWAANGLAEDAEYTDTAWLGFNNDLASQRYSVLKEINTSNVAGLKEICRIELSDGG